MEGLSIKDAATMLGVSEKTVRNRAQSGKLPAIKAERPQGYEWRIYPDGLPSGLEQASQVVPNGNQVEGDLIGDVVPPAQTESSDLTRLLEKMYEDNRQLAGQVGFLQAKLQDAESTIQRLLMAPKDEPSEPAPATLQVAAPAKRPWWKVWGR